ncbi:MAG: hypothetical protein HC875_24520 [Anaerolineales bacterium]|nr:hypothetical protein [Anaerolineales bacterium]
MSDAAEYSQLYQLMQKVARLEQKIDFILQHLDLEYREQDEPAPAYIGQIRSLLQQGNKIEAIKIYREATGVGLAEAKAAVEAIEAGR